MANNIGYEEFFGLNKDGSTPPVENTPAKEGSWSVENGLKDFNNTLGLVNSILDNLGVDKSIIKQKLQEKMQPPQQQAQRPMITAHQDLEAVSSAGNTQSVKQQEQPKKEKMTMSIKKITKMIDLVLKFTKQEDMKVSELKQFLEDNENLIEEVIN